MSHTMEDDRMDDPITVRCVCGWQTSGPEIDVICATQEHGERIHNMRATREQVLAMAVSAPASAEAGATGSGPSEGGA
jgi:hypothetical protein